MCICSPNIKQDFIDIDEDHRFDNNNIKEKRDTIVIISYSLILYYPDCFMR